MARPMQPEVVESGTGQKLVTEVKSRSLLIGHNLWSLIPAETTDCNYVKLQHVQFKLQSLKSILQL